MLLISSMSSGWFPSKFQMKFKIDTLPSPAIWAPTLMVTPIGLKCVLFYYIHRIRSKLIDCDAITVRRRCWKWNIYSVGIQALGIVSRSWYLSTSCHRLLGHDQSLFSYLKYCYGCAPVFSAEFPILMSILLHSLFSRLVPGDIKSETSPSASSNDWFYLILRFQ